MKISKLLNKRSLSILLVFSLIYFSDSYAEDEPVDIWDLEKETNQDTPSLIIEEGTESDQTKTIIEKNISTKTINVIDSVSLDKDKVNIIGLYDPEDNGLTMNMWSYSNGDEIKLILKKLNKINLSKDAKEILDIALLTNSYFPEENITEEEFIDFKSTYLINNNDKNLIKLYLIKNANNIYNSKLIEFFLNDYLENADLESACEIFDEIDFFVNSGIT